MIVTTTPSVEGKRIKKYCGVATGDAMLGTDFMRDFIASITNLVGGRASEYESVLREAKDIAMKEMEEVAKEAGANAIVGVDVDYEYLNGMLLVSMSGTAVKLE